MSHYKEEHYYYYYLKESEKRKKLYKKFLIFSCFSPIIFFLKKQKIRIIFPWKQRNKNIQIFKNRRGNWKDVNVRKSGIDRSL